MLTGAYPDKTESVVVGDVTFKVALLPPRVHRQITSKLAQFAGMTEEGITRSGKLDELLEAYEDCVKWAVRGHSGLKDESGIEIPYKGSREVLKGEPHDVVSDETLRVYYYKGIQNTLGPKILDLCTISGQDAKN